MPLVGISPFCYADSGILSHRTDAELKQDIL